MGAPVLWHTKYHFRINIEGVTYAYFTTCSEIKAEIAVIEHQESGQRHPHKVPGTVKFPDITLTRGQSENMDLYNLFLETYSASATKGTDKPELDRVIEIEQLNAQRDVVTRWLLHNAWFSQYASGDWDAKADEVLIESVVIAYEWFERQLA